MTENLFKNLARDGYVVIKGGPLHFVSSEICTFIQEQEGGQDPTRFYGGIRKDKLPQLTGGLRQLFLDYEKCALNIFADLLKQCPELKQFDGYLDSVMAPCLYPAATQGTCLLKAHIDHTLFTLLSGPVSQGLVFLGEKEESLEIRPDEMVLFSGSLLARLSNNVFRPRPHKILSPGHERISVPFFVQPFMDFEMSLPGTSQKMTFKNYSYKYSLLH